MVNNSFNIKLWTYFIIGLSKLYDNIKQNSDWECLSNGIILNINVLSAVIK